MYQDTTASFKQAEDYNTAANEQKIYRNDINVEAKNTLKRTTSPETNKQDNIHTKYPISGSNGLNSDSLRKNKIDKNINNNYNHFQKNDSLKSLEPSPIVENNKVFLVKNITGDKNSLYRAVAEGIINSEDHFMMLKFFIANFACRKNELEELHIKYYIDEYSFTFQEFLEKMQDDILPVGELDLIMLSRILNLDVTISHGKQSERLFIN